MAQTKVKLISDGVIVQSNLHASHGITTAHIGEGSNLYYTNARSRAAISVSGNALSYNSSTGVITSNFEESPTFTGNVNISNSSPALNLTDTDNSSNIAFSSVGGALIVNSASDQVYQIGGAEKMRLNSSGNLGIGTTSPGAKLEIFGTGNTLRLDSAANQSKTILLRNVGSGTAEIKTDGDLKLNAEDSGKTIQLFTENTERMRITSGGNISIDRTTDSVGGAPGGTDGRLNVYTDEGSSAWAQQTRHDSTTGNGLFIRAGASSSYYTAYFAGHDESNVHFVVRGDGNVGIGTTSPSGKLNVEASGNHLHLRAGTAAAGKYWNFDVTANNQLYIITDGNNGINITNLGYVGIGTVTNTARLNVGGKVKITDDLIMAQTNGRIDYDNGVSSGALRFHSTSANSEKMRITSAGNVGIGTTGPSAKLDVQGTSALLMLRTSGGLATYIENDGGHPFMAMYQIGGGAKVLINTNGNSYFNGGNVIIGNTNVDNPNSLTKVLEIENGGTVGVILNDSRDNPMGLENRGAVFHLTYNTNSILVAEGSTGNVGIGTTTIPNPFSGAYSNILQVGTTSGHTRLAITSGDTKSCDLTFADSNDATNAGSTIGMIAYKHDLNAMLFVTNGLERMRITGAGLTNLQTNTNGAQIAQLAHTGTVPYGMQVVYTGASPNTTDNYFFLGTDSAANRIIIWGNGNIQNQNNSYGAISDIKLKENIVDATPKLDDLMKVKIRHYNLIGDDKKQIGVIAQELEDVFPNMIDESIDFEHKEVTDEQGNVSIEKIDLGTTTKSVKYSVFVPMLIKSIQELKKEIEILKTQINN